MSLENNKKKKLYATKEDLERAFRKVKEFQKLIERGKTPRQIFDDLCRLIEVGE